MYGLAVLGIGLIYIVFSLWISVKLGRLLGKQFGKVWLWGFLILLLINTPILYKTVVPTFAKPFYCEQAGLWLYKTPEQWTLENPGVAEILELDGEQVDRDLGNGRAERIFHLNQRFDWKLTYQRHWDNIMSKEQVVIDRKTGEVMARRMDAGWNLPRPLTIQDAGTCFRKDEREKWGVGGHGFRIYMENFQNLGEQK